MKNTISPKHVHFDKSYYLRQDKFALSERYRKELEVVLNSLNPRKGDLVLDIGCNTGNAAIYIAERSGCKVIGIDFPEPWLGTCKLKSYFMADAHHLPFKSCVFDKVYMLHVLSHVTMPELVLKEVARVLRKGGYFGMINPNKYFVYSMRPLNYSGIIKYDPDKTVLRYYSKSETNMMVRISGMSVEKNEVFGALPPYLKRYGDSGLFRGLRERIFTLART